MGRAMQMDTDIMRMPYLATMKVFNSNLYTWEHAVMNTNKLEISSNLRTRNLDTLLFVSRSTVPTLWIRCNSTPP